MTAPAENEPRLRTALLPAVLVGALALPAAGLAGARPSASDWIGWGACALAQLAFLALAREPRAAFLALAAGVLQGFLAASTLAGTRAALAALLPLASALAAQLELTRQAATAAHSARIPWTRLGPERRGALARLSSATGHTLVLCALAAGLALCAALLTRGTRALLAPDPAPTLAEVGTETRAAQSGRASEGGTAGLSGHFPGELRWESGTPIEDDTPIVRVRTADAEALGGLLYLRGNVQERFTAAGLAPRASEARALPRGRSGWTTIVAPPPGERVLEFELEQVPLSSGDGEVSVLFVPTPLVALERAGASLQPDGALFAPLPLEGPLRSRARALERRLERLDGARGALGSPGPEALSLPPPRERAGFEALARRLFRDAPDPATRRANVLTFFRDEFRYEPGLTGSAGLAGLEEFLARRSGICTHFAAAATLLLRLGDVPARVATGFLARPDPSEPGLFVATPRGAHAWVEVWDEAHGWITCDPTPAARAGGDALPLAEARARAWWTGSLDLLASFLGGESISYARLRGTWSELRQRLDGRAASWLLGPALLIALAFALRRRALGRQKRATERGSSPAADAHARLHAALARAGHPRPPARTLLRHAEDLARTALGPSPALDELVQRLYRARFGPATWSADDERLLTQVVAQLAGKPPLSEGTRG